jgi:tetratricopeptide (TPR) repeat protein
MLLLPAMLAGLCAIRRWRTAAKVLLAAGGMIALTVFIHYIQHGEPTGYEGSWAISLLELKNLFQLIDNVNRVANAFFVVLPLAAYLPYSLPGFILNAMLTTLVLLMSIIGLPKWNGSSPFLRAFFVSVTVFMLTFYAVHILWNFIDARYGLPLLPLLIGLLLGGGYALYQRGTRSIRWIMTGALLLVMTNYSWQNARGIFNVFYQQPTLESRPVKQTLAWMRTNLAATAIIQTARYAETFLYSGHPCVTVFQPGSREEYRFWLLQSGATNVLARATRIQTSGINLQRAWILNQHWAASWSKAFRPIYQNSEEATIVYEVVPDANYVIAFSLYLQAREALNRSLPEEGLRLLNLSLDRDPSLTSALNAYGAACLLGRRSLSKAESRLQKAIRLQPDHAMAWLNLARLHQQEGRLTEARRDYQHAAEAVVTAPEYDFILPTILQELRAISRVDSQARIS